MEARVLWGDLRVRRLQAERMDDPGLEVGEHRRALAGLRRINAWSGTVGAVWGPIREECRRHGGRAVRVLDVACGGGDVAIGLWRQARVEGWRLEVVGCDRSRVAVEVGRSEAARVGAEVGFEERDVIADGVPENYDVVMSTLFLHHLGEEEAWGLLRSMWGSGAGLVVVDDLERGWWGWVLAWLGSRVLSRSPVVHGDALKSVEGAWTGIEAVGLARSAGWLEVELRRHWPARYLMVGRPR